MKLSKYLYSFLTIFFIVVIVIIVGYTKQGDKGFLRQSESGTTQALQKQKYCGDGTCEGPETGENCPEDCGERTNQAALQQPSEKDKDYENK